jgi:hypothetical protein
VGSTRFLVANPRSATRNPRVVLCFCRGMKTFPTCAPRRRFEFGKLAQIPVQELGKAKRVGAVTDAHPVPTQTHHNISMSS